jgi:glutathione S-transferase
MNLASLSDLDLTRPRAVNPQKNTPYLVYSISGAPRPWRVLLGLIAKGLEFEVRVLDASKKEHKAPEFLALNARGRVPVIERDGFVLSESLAILSYLEQQHPEPPLFGTSAEEHARIWQLVSAGEHDLNDASNALLLPLFSRGKDDADDEVQRAALAVHEEFKRLERQLSDSLFLFGQRMSAADCVCFPHARLVLRAGERFPEVMRRLELHPLPALYPQIAKWLGRVEALPGYERTFPPHWRAA